MASAREELDEINRIHDDDPTQAAARLRALDSSALPRDSLPLAAFLYNHVLGEKIGMWSDAAQHIDRLHHRHADLPPAVMIHAAVADELAGRDTTTARAALAAASSDAAAECAIGLRRLSFTQDRMDTATFATVMGDLVQRAQALPTGTTLDTQLAAGLNNATSRLLDLNPNVGDQAVCNALQAGAAQALRFWRAAGNWVNHERALYLVALTANRIGAYVQARDAARQGLDVIAANGSEDVDRAFLLLQLAGAHQRLGEDTASRAARRDAQAIAATWTEAWLAEWFAGEEAKLFGPPAKAVNP
jgi:hypothetical protein